MCWFKVLKTKYVAEWNNWFTNVPNKRTTRKNNIAGPGYDLMCSWIVKGWSELSPDSIAQSFVCCGLTSDNREEYHSVLQKVLDTKENPLQEYVDVREIDDDEEYSGMFVTDDINDNNELSSQGENVSEESDEDGEEDESESEDDEDESESEKVEDESEPKDDEDESGSEHDEESEEEDGGVSRSKKRKLGNSTKPCTSKQASEREQKVKRRLKSSSSSTSDTNMLTTKKTSLQKSSTNQQPRSAQSMSHRTKPTSREYASAPYREEFYKEYGLKDKPCYSCEKLFKRSNPVNQLKWVSCEECQNWACNECLPCNFKHQDEFYCSHCLKK